MFMWRIYWFLSEIKAGHWFISWYIFTDIISDYFTDSGLENYFFAFQIFCFRKESYLFQITPPIVIILLFPKAKLSIFAWCLHSEKIFDWIKKMICLKHFLWCKEMFCFNETKLAWFKQNIFGLNKYLFESNKFLL